MKKLKTLFSILVRILNVFLAALKLLLFPIVMIFAIILLFAKEEKLADRLVRFILPFQI